MCVSNLKAFVIAGCLCIASAGISAASEPSPSESLPLDLFNERIAPIFQSPNPSSCVQCHLSSVDLKNYILPSSDATFVSLRDQGLIDVDHPDDSKILQLIRMGDKDADEVAKLIHEKTRVAELEAFAAWVKACCADERLLGLPAAEALARPAAPDAVIRHARKSRIVDSFARNGWSQRMRCFPCHTPHEIDPENPKHQGAIRKRAEFAEKYGPEMLDRLAIFRKSPEATLAYLIKSSEHTPDDRLPLLNLTEPANSLLVLKPMAKLPPKHEDGSLGEPGYLPPNITHNGGLKLHKNDQSYKSMVTWIRDYANVVGAKYQAVDDLPLDNWHPTKLVIRVKAAPDEWAVKDLVQLFVYARNATDDGWQQEPIAFTQGMVTPRRMVNGGLFRLGSENTNLPRGRYLVKAFWDSKHRIATDPSLMLTQEDYYGEAEIPKARWREGFRFAEVVAGKSLSSPDASAD